MEKIYTSHNHNHVRGYIPLKVLYTCILYSHALRKNWATSNSLLNTKEVTETWLGETIKITMSSIMEYLF